jgi:hypothetical protein
MTDKKNEALIAALLREREGYVRNGKEDRVKQVDEQLKVYGYKRDSEETRKTPPVERTAERQRETTARPEGGKG